MYILLEWRGMLKYSLELYNFKFLKIIINIIVSRKSKLYRKNHEK